MKLGPDLLFAAGNVDLVDAFNSENNWLLQICLEKEWAGLVLDCDRDNSKSTTGYVFALAGGAVSWVSKLQSNINQDHNKLPPGPPKLPIIGNMHQMLGPLPHRILQKLSKRYGPIMHLKLGEISHVIVSSPAVAREIMKTRDPNFADRAISATTKIEEVHNLMLSISSSHGSVVNLSQKIIPMINTILTRFAIGDKWKDQAEFLSTMKDVVSNAAGNDLSDLFPSLSWLMCLISRPKVKVLEECFKKVDPVIEGIIQQHKDKRTNQGEGGKDCKNDNLVDILIGLQERDLQFEIDADCIKAVILDIIGAGSETSSTVILWAMSELMKNPRVMKRVQSEMREILKGKAAVTETDTKQLTYLHLVIKETLRLHAPAALLLPQVCQKTTEVHGYVIQEKTRVIVNTWAIGRDPLYWEDAEEFKPERFEGSLIDYKGEGFELLAFGAGRRTCPGMIFGLADVELPLAQMLYYFDWELPDGVESDDLDMSETYGLTARRKSDLCLRAISRIPYVEV
ncbi:premnaspirodiene oxygenase-like [Asparagus officinalis]|uniref:premnaspirodiene oxygenase-like n=1 Tax=Asparagus officinalis TaxID=4686 RepID=UPI00098E18CB|nr:premnaspirodiene oxygenase-like [Asparagus officinalis]